MDAPVLVQKKIKMALTTATPPTVQDSTKYHCNHCFSDCSGLRVSCAECSDYDSCLKCFSKGVESGCHKKNHDYCFVDNGTFSLIIPGWTADEEMLLLDGIEQHGLGNWDDISDHVGTKTSHEVQEHFEEIYLWKNIGTATLPKSTTAIIDHTLIDGELAPSLTDNSPPVDIPACEAQELGFMPFRDDFEREYENESENLVKMLICSREDDELETALKLSLADMYWRSLKERARRKKCAKQYGLITTKHKLNASRRKLTKEDREFKDKIRVFAQFLLFSQWEELITNRIRERELKEKIKDLIRYRRNGIQKLSACQEYEEHKEEREKKREMKRRMVISPPRNTKTSKKEVDEDKKLPLDTDVSSAINDFLDQMKQDPCDCMISEKEKQFCASLQLKFSKYFNMKTFILNEYAAKRTKTAFKFKPPSCMDTNVRDTLTEFFVQCGWMDE